MAAVVIEIFVVEMCVNVAAVAAEYAAAAAAAVGDSSVLLEAAFVEVAAVRAAKAAAVDAKAMIDHLVPFSPMPNCEEIAAVAGQAFLKPKFAEIAAVVAALLVH